MHRSKVLATILSVFLVVGVMGTFGSKKVFADLCCGAGADGNHICNGSSCNGDACANGNCQPAHRSCYKCLSNFCTADADVIMPATCPSDCSGCPGGGGDPPPPPGATNTPVPTTCGYTNLTIEVSADGISWGSSADTVRAANGYTKRFYRIQSGGSPITDALTTAPITMKWEKTATTGGGAVRVVDTYVTTPTVTSLKHNPICSLVTSGNYFVCETPVDKRTENIGDAGDYKYTVSSPKCTDTTATYKITTATQQTNCPVQGVRMEYSADNINWKQNGQYFQSLPPKMCARVVDVSTNRVVDRDYIEQRYWKPSTPVTSPPDSSSETNAVTGGWVPWKNNQSVYDTGCWTPTTAQMLGIWTEEARLYGLNTCSSKAKFAVGEASTCSGNALLTPPIYLYKSLGDANGDCEVDLIHDFVQFIREKTRFLTTLLADFDASGSVDTGDFAIWKSGYQSFRVR